jgi:hypothetical protein
MQLTIDPYHHPLRPTGHLLALPIIWEQDVEKGPPALFSDVEKGPPALFSRHSEAQRTTTGTEPVSAGSGRVGKNDDAPPPRHGRLTDSQACTSLALFIHRAVHLAAASLDGLFEHAARFSSAIRNNPNNWPRRITLSLENSDEKL